jgi:hypothetical protein
MLVDISDVFFLQDPFAFMAQAHQGALAKESSGVDLVAVAKEQPKFSKEHRVQDVSPGLFLSADAGTVSNNSWMHVQVSRCYKESPKNWSLRQDGKRRELLLMNAGVWGGMRQRVLPLLVCIRRELEYKLKGRGNCNMPAYNFCVHVEEATHPNGLATPVISGAPARYAPEVIYQGGNFVNPMRQACRQWWPVIHNKCGARSCPKIPSVTNTTLIGNVPHSPAKDGEVFAVRNITKLLPWPCRS